MYALQVVNRPYLSVVNNIIMSINESVFLILGCAFFIFSEDCTSSRCLMMSNAIIAIVVFIVTINLLTLWVIKICDIVGQIRQYLKARNGTKKGKGVKDGKEEKDRREEKGEMERKEETPVEVLRR